MTKSSVFAALLALGGANLAQAGVLEVDLSNLRPDGAVRVELFADAQSWEQNRPLRSAVFAARELRHTVVFDGLAPGHYAVRAEQAGADGAQRGAPQFVSARRGNSGSGLNQRAPFAAAAVEVIDDPRIEVRMFADGRY